VGDSARLIEIMGSFGTNGSNAPVAANVKGMDSGMPIAGVMTLQATRRPGISGTPGITHTATGTYIVTFDDSYLDLIYAARISWSQRFGQLGAAGTILCGRLTGSLNRYFS